MFRFLALLSVVNALGFSYIDYFPSLAVAEVCSSPDALAKDFVVSISSDNLQKGENLTTIFDFTLDQPITAGAVEYSASLNGFPYSSSASLCDEVAKSDDPCPLEIGVHHQVSTSTMTVTGKLTTTITWTDDSGQEILCAKITVKSV